MGSELNEQQMQQLEAEIPRLAHDAFQRARRAALNKVGHVVEARNGHLLMIDANGTQTVVGTVARPTHVKIGERKTRARA